jgi:hypothetical protein
LRQILDYAEHKVNGILDEYGRVIPIIVYKWTNYDTSLPKWFKGILFESNFEERRK